MKAPPLLLQQCFDDVRQEAPRLLGRCLEAMIQRLLVSDSGHGASSEGLVADRKSRAWAGLMQHKAAWCKAYPDRIIDAFVADDSGHPSSRMSLLSDSRSLSLVDEDEFNEQLEFKRALQTLVPLVERELAVLDARMSSLLGAQAVAAELNPLRPSVFLRQFHDLMVSGESDRTVRTVWLKAAAEPLAAELRGLYERVAARLQRANVGEAGYRVRLSGESTGPKLTEDSPETNYGLTSEWFDLPGAESRAPVSGPVPLHDDLADIRSEVDHGLYQRFLSEGGEAYEQPLERSYFRAVALRQRQLREARGTYVHDEAGVMARRVQYRHLPAVDRPPRTVDTQTPLSEGEWGELAHPVVRDAAFMDMKSRAETVADAMGLDVVRMLVNQVARDQLLLGPVREAIVALEPALLGRAAAAPRFFDDPEDPARRLVESVAQRSFRYNDEFADDFRAFFIPVQKVFRDLASAPRTDGEAFLAAVSTLQGQWDALDASERSRRDESVQVVQRAEDRQQMADRVAWEISQRPDVANAPGFILDFLYGPWALVIASAQMKASDGAVDPGGYRKAMSHLLWSIRKEVTLRLPAQLFAVLPTMLQTLRAGLASLGQQPADSAPFFEELMRLHEPVLRLRQARKRADARASGAMPLEPEAEEVVEFHEPAPATPEQRIPREADQPWLGARELAVAGFAETSPEPLAPLAAVQLGGSAHPADALAVGEWVDLYVQGEWLRAELVWASAKRTLFLFISRGGRSHSMTRRSCERLMQQRWLRPLGAHSVLGQAMEIVDSQGRGEPSAAV